MYIAILFLIMSLLVGCVSPYQIPGTDDEFLVTKHSEIRSPFGTNGGFDFLEKCKGPSRPVLFYFQADFTDCKPAIVSDGQVLHCGDSKVRCMILTGTTQHKSSQGQGGQIVSGMMNAAALGGVAAAAGSAGNAASSASSTAIMNVTVRGGHGYGHK